MTTASQREDRAVPSGRIERVDSDYVLAFDRQFDYPRQYIWSLLTEPDQLAKWLGKPITGFELGHPYELDVGGGAVTGMVLQLNPPLSLQFTWEDELGGEAVIEWRTLDSNGGTLLQFRSRAENRDFLTEGSAGWDTLLDALEDVAAGRIPQPQPERWDRLREAYAREYSLSNTMGTVDTDSGHPCIQFDRLVAADRESVWQALTDESQFSRWLAPGSLELQVGAAIRLDFETFTMEGDVSHVLHGQALEYGWRSPEVQDSSVHWQLEGNNGRTVLKLRHDLRSAARDAQLLAFWHHRLDALAVLLSGGEVHLSAHRLEALNHFYRRQTGGNQP
jgi:uncharacterized protein YndB with AHSA1/START domain